MSKWVLMLWALVVVGCSATARANSPAPIAVTMPSPSSTTAMSANNASPSAIASTMPPTTPPGLEPASTSPASASSLGWKTYANASWHVAVDYPPDWTVRQDAAAVTFVSPRGATIQLAPVAAGEQPPETALSSSLDLPNTRCTSQTNEHGIAAYVCFDTISFSTYAQFIVKATDGSEQLLSLGTNRKNGDVAVFTAMLASIRPGS
jgi:hypothetical protein